MIAVGHAANCSDPREDRKVTRLDRICRKKVKGFRKHLHTKGVLLKRGLLTGSMNLTHNGLELNDEMVVYDTTLKTIAEARLNFESYVEAAT